RSPRHRPRPDAQPGNDAQHPPEPLLRVRLQYPWHPARRGGPLPGLRAAPESDDRERSDEPELGLGDHKCSAPAKARAHVTPTVGAGLDEPSGMRYLQPADRGGGTCPRSVREPSPRSWSRSWLVRPRHGRAESESTVWTASRIPWCKPTGSGPTATPIGPVTGSARSPSARWRISSAP